MVVLYNIVIEVGVPAKIVRLITMCLTETYNTVRVDKNLSDTFPIRNGLKQGEALLSLFFNFTLDNAIRRVRINRDGLKLNDQNVGRSYIINIESNSIGRV
jgi:hypothetical protein